MRTHWYLLIVLLLIPSSIALYKWLVVEAEAEQGIIEKDNDIFFTYKTLFQQYADDNALGLNDEMIERLAEQATYAAIMAVVFDQDWTGTVSDIFGYLFAPNVSFIARDVTDMGSWWSSARIMKKYNRAFRNLPIERRLLTFLALLEEVRERTPNNLKSMEILTGIVSGEEYENIAMYQMLDKLGVFAMVLILLLGLVLLGKLLTLHILPKKWETT